MNYYLITLFVSMFLSKIQISFSNLFCPLYEINFDFILNIIIISAFYLSTLKGIFFSFFTGFFLDTLTTSISIFYTLYYIFSFISIKIFLKKFHFKNFIFIFILTFLISFFEGFCLYIIYSIYYNIDNITYLLKIFFLQSLQLGILNSIIFLILNHIKN